MTVGSKAYWTTNPTITGAYWFKSPCTGTDIVWIRDGKVFGITNYAYTETAKDQTYNGGMFYGPLDQPPPMPQVTATLENEALEVLRQAIDTYQRILFSNGKSSQNQQNY